VRGSVTWLIGKIWLAALAGMMAMPAQAQLVSTIAGVQTRIAADPNGVDLVTDSFNFQPDLTFGPNAQARLALVTEHGSGLGDNYLRPDWA